MTTNTKMEVIFVCLLLLLIISTSASASASTKHRTIMCKNLTVYFHDIIFDGKNQENFTSIIAAAPPGGNLTNLAPNFNHFGNIIVFDNPITVGSNLNSRRVGRAQGTYFYSGKNVLFAWFGFSIIFDSGKNKGSINFAGSDPMMVKTRDLSVIGGTGDFFMTRGIATLTTDAREGDAYFRVKIDIKLYEC